MFTDARVAPVHVSSSYTLTSSGLKDFLQDKLYNTARTGADFKKCLQDTFAMGGSDGTGNHARGGWATFHVSSIVSGADGSSIAIFGGGY